MVRSSVRVFGGSGIFSAPVPDSYNREGYPAFTRPLEEQFVQTLLANTLNGVYYAAANEMQTESKAVHDQMLAKDKEFYAKALVFARQNGFMRTQPIYGLVQLSKADPALFAQVFDRVIRTPNDLSDFATILASMRNGSQGGRAVKRAAGAWLTKHFNALRDDELEGQYWAIKYGAEKSEGGYSLADLVKVYHPVMPSRKKNPLIDYILGGPLKDKTRSLDHQSFSRLPQIEQFELLKRAKTDEEKAQAILLGRLPHEVATSFAGSSKQVWNAIVPNMPIFALLRNLATLERHGVLDENRKIITDLLTNPKAVQTSKILPFRFAEAFKHVNSPWVQDCLRDALELSFANVPEIDGKTAVMLDISGSMSSPVSRGVPHRGSADGPAAVDVGAIFGVSLMKKAGGNGYFIAFDTRADEINVSMRDSVLTQAGKIHARGGTDHTVAMDKLGHRHVDNIVYITDEQQNTGSPLFTRIAAYRKQVNRDVNVFVMDVSGLRNALLPPDPKTFFVYGWSDQALQFVSLSSRGWGTQIDAVKTVPLVG